MRSIPGSPWIKYKVMPYKEYKPEKLYYSIGEVAEILGESTSLVRFWSDSFPELDVENLRIIHHLVKDQRMTLEGAASRMRVNKEGLDRRTEAVERLRGIRESLLEISQLLNSRL